MSAARRGIPLAFLPGDDQPDPELSARSTLPADAAHRLWQYGVQGGIENAQNSCAYAVTLIGRDTDWREPVRADAGGNLLAGRGTGPASTISAGNGAPMARWRRWSSIAPWRRAAISRWSTR